MVFRFDDYKYDTCKNLIAKCDYDFSQFPEQEVFCNSDAYYKRTLAELYISQNTKTEFKQIMVSAAGIAPTLNCGLRCTYCSQSATDGHLDALSEAEIELFIREIVTKKVVESFAIDTDPSLPFIIAGGGEPTYNWALFTRVITLAETICRDNDVKVEFSIITNGILTEAQCNFIADHISNVTISYDGTSDLQNSNRKFKDGKNSSQIVEKAILYLLSTKKTNVSIHSTIWHHDLSKLKAMAHYIANTFPGISSWQIFPVVSAGRAIKIFLNNHAELKKNNFVDYYLEVKELFKKSNIEVSAPFLSHSFIGFQCHAVGPAISTLWLTPNGRIITCIDSSDIAMEVGFISNGKINDSTHLNNTLIDMGIKKYLECRECIAFPVCGGGCPIQHISEEQNHTRMMEWMCDMRRYYWIHVLTCLVKNGEYENLFLATTNDPNVFTIKEI